MNEMTKRTQDAIRARDTLVFVETVEEMEAIKNIQALGLAMQQSVVTWDPVQSFKDITPNGGMQAMAPMGDIDGLHGMLNEIANYAGDCIFILQDVSFFMNDRTEPPVLANLIRNFKLLKRELRATKKTIILFGTNFNLPHELEDDFVLISHQRPNKEQLHKIMEDNVKKETKDETTE